MPENPEPDLYCVGALIRNEHSRVFAHRRSHTRKLFPGLWDIVGGHVDPGETVERALAREIEEETGWTLRAVQARLPTWDWTANGERRREYDFLVEVDGDLTAPRLEEGKHDAYEWVGPDNLDLMMVGRTDGDRRLRDVVAAAVRTRLTERLYLVPAGPEHAEELLRLHQEPAVAEWHGPWTLEGARQYAATCQGWWETDGVGKWMAYDRTTGAPVGRGGLSWKPIEGTLRLELGWTLHPDRWGHGYATEIGRAGLTFGFDELGACLRGTTPAPPFAPPARAASPGDPGQVDEIIAFTEPHNRRSRAVMERLGMRQDREFVHAGERFVLYVTRRSDQTRTATQPSTTTEN